MGYHSILVLSCFFWGSALDSSNLLLSYHVVSLASHITTILISTLQHKILPVAVNFGGLDEVLKGNRGSNKDPPFVDPYPQSNIVRVKMQKISSLPKANQEREGVSSAEWEKCVVEFGHTGETGKFRRGGEGVIEIGFILY